MLKRRGSEPVRGAGFEPRRLHCSVDSAGYFLPASAGVQNLFGGEKILHCSVDSAGSFLPACRAGSIFFLVYLSVHSNLTLHEV